MVAEVARAVDVARGGRASRLVEKVGDRLERLAATGVEVEDLGDHRCLLRIGLQRDAMLLPVPQVARGQALEHSAVAVGGSTPHAVALLARLAHPALGLARELDPLELVPQLLHAHEQRALRGRGVARAGRVVDLDAALPQLPLIERGDEPVARQPRGRVDDDRVEPATVAITGLVREGAPAGAVLLGAGFLIGELAGDGAAEILGLAPASLELAGERERGILLVGGRQATVEGHAEIAHLMPPFPDVRPPRPSCGRLTGPWSGEFATDGEAGRPAAQAGRSGAGEGGAS
nr:hypothetical protein [Patulibacter sp. DM4]